MAEGLSQSTKRPITDNGRKKTAKQRKDDEEIIILQRIAKSLENGGKKENEKEKAEDPCTAFGSYIARTLQLMDERSPLTAMNSVQNIIFQVQMSSINQNGNGHPGNFNTSFT